MVLTQSSTMKVYDDDHFTELLDMTNSQFDEGLDSSALNVLLENLHENVSMYYLGTITDHKIVKFL